MFSACRKLRQNAPKLITFRTTFFLGGPSPSTTTTHLDVFGASSLLAEILNTPLASQTPGPSPYWPELTREIRANAARNEGGVGVSAW